MKELDDVFNDEEEAEVETEEVETEETTEEENTEGEETAETEESEVEAQAETEETEEEVPATPEPVMVPLAAKQAEKERRQRAEQRAEELENELKQFKVTDPDKPDMYEDPEAYERWVEDQARAKLAEEQSAAQKARINESREKILEEKADYLDAEDAFFILANRRPELVNEMLNSANPAEYAYNKGMEHLNSLMSSIKSASVKQKPEIPVSLAKASAKGANTVEVEKDYDDFDEIFADMKY